MLLLQLDVLRVQVHQALQWLIQDAIIHTLAVVVHSACILGSRVGSGGTRIVTAILLHLFFHDYLLVLLLRSKDSRNDYSNSIISKEVFKQFLLFLWFELTDVDAVDIRYLNLISPDLNAFDVFEL